MELLRRKAIDLQSTINISKYSSFSSNRLNNKKLNFYCITKCILSLLRLQCRTNRLFVSMHCSYQYLFDMFFLIKDDPHTKAQ